MCSLMIGNKVLGPNSFWHYRNILEMLLKYQIIIHVIRQYLDTSFLYYCLHLNAYLTILLLKKSYTSCVIYRDKILRGLKYGVICSYLYNPF